jgi:S-DNA-T family DNA segregation ATPase FtsK/SpoIIIE
MGGAPIHRPVAPPLPEQIPYPASTFAAPAAGDVRRHGSTGGGPLPQPAAPAGQGALELGWVDLPPQQLVTTLTWSPAENGHLALIGTSAGGVDDAARLAVRQLLAGTLESHLYILDADNSFSAAATLPCVGAVASLHELRRGARVLERLAAEMAARLGAPAPAAHPPLLLVVSSWGSWVSAYRSGPLQWAEDVLHDIVRDGTKAGITVVVSGDRELVTARFFASIPNRAYFPAGSTEDSRLAWPRLPAVPSVPGRAVVFGPLVEGSQSVAQFFALPHHDPAEWREVTVPGRPPFRIEPLPTRITVAEIQSRVRSRQTAAAGPGTTIDSSRGRHRRLLVGVGGDELDPFWVPLSTGSVVAVLGGPSSGKTSLLRALPELNPQIADWLPCDAEANADSYWSGLAAKASSGVIQPAVVCVDDADLLSPDAHHSLMDLHGLGWTLILACGFSLNPVQRVPLMVQARNPGVGILIAPRTVTDGDFFGVRIEREAHPPPGRAVVLSDGKATPVQLGFLDPVPLQNRRSASGT